MTALVPTTRPHRPLLKRACLRTAVVVLLLTAYFGSWLVYVFALGAGWLPAGWANQSARAVYSPIEVYIIQDYPGAQTLTLPNGFPMAGYYHERRAEGATDPLQAKAIVFRSESQQAALVVCDLIGISMRRFRRA